jgi:hypothetical protein
MPIAELAACRFCVWVWIESALKLNRDSRAPIEARAADTVLIAVSSWASAAVASAWVSTFGAVTAAAAGMAGGTPPGPAGTAATAALTPNSVVDLRSDSEILMVSAASEPTRTVIPNSGFPLASLTCAGGVPLSITALLNGLLLSSRL